MGVWHNRIIFDFFYSEYWHNRLVLSFSVKAEVHSFEGRVGMRLSDYIVRVLIYCNLSGLFPPNALYKKILDFAKSVANWKMEHWLIHLRSVRSCICDDFKWKIP